MNIDQLSQEFLNKYAANRLRPSTIRGYRTNLKHIAPVLGKKAPDELTPDDLDELTDHLREKGLSGKSIIYCHATLRKALNYSIKRGYFVYNVYDRYDLPHAEGYSYRVLNEDQISDMLSNADGRSSICLAIRLGLRYGLRRGEVLGICPELDLDLRTRTLHVQRTRTVEERKEVVTSCKTKYSNRYILLMQEDAEALRAVSTLYAVPLTPTQLNKRFKAFLRRGGFPEIRFHDLRHSYATLMLSKGINPKIVSSVLGHSGVDVTLDIYSHPDVRMQHICLEVLP